MHIFSQSENIRDNFIHPRSFIHICIYTLRTRQSWCNFVDDIFKCIFLNDNIWIPITISFKFVPKGQINNIPALVQIMAASHYLNQWWSVNWCTYTSFGFNELICTINLTMVLHSSLMSLLDNKFVIYILCTWFCWLCYILVKPSVCCELIRVLCSERW